MIIGNIKFVSMEKVLKKCFLLILIATFFWVELRCCSSYQIHTQCLLLFQTIKKSFQKCVKEAKTITRSHLKWADDDLFGGRIENWTSQKSTGISSRLQSEIYYSIPSEASQVVLLLLCLWWTMKMISLLYTPRRCFRNRIRKKR